MSVVTGYNISVKVYNKISKYNDLEIKTEKKFYLKISPVKALGMIKEETYKDVNNIPDSLSQYEIQKKLYFAELLIFLWDYYQCDWKISPKSDGKN